MEVADGVDTEEVMVVDKEVVVATVVVGAKVELVVDGGGVELEDMSLL